MQLERLLKAYKSKFLLVCEALALLSIILVLAVLSNAWLKNRKILDANYDFSQVIAIETLVVEGKSEKLDHQIQDTKTFTNGTWTNDNQIIVGAHDLNAWIRFLLPVEKNKPFRLIVYLTKSYDYGIVQVFADGKTVGEPIDLWSELILSTGPIEVGEVLPLKDLVALEFKVVGKSPGSTPPFYQFGIDGVKIEYIAK